MWRTALHAGFHLRFSDILGLIAAGASREEILADYDLLEPEDITAALTYATRQIGPGNAAGAELLDWTREHGHVVVTQDLDFSQLLFATQASGPSVVLLRMDNNPTIIPLDCSGIACSS